MAIHGLIFDFDGIIPDSEVLANAVLAETISNLGRVTTLADALSRYMGKRWPGVIALIESDVGQVVPADFAACLEAKTFERFRAELCEVMGARDGYERQAEPGHFSSGRIVDEGIFGHQAINPQPRLTDIDAAGGRA
jgi:phosphoglycolate phosphatase-like HAD superfamily hydrolase